MKQALNITKKHFLRGKVLVFMVGLCVLTISIAIYLSFINKSK